MRFFAQFLKQRHRIDWFSVLSDLEMKMLGGGATRSSRQGDLLSASHLLPFFYKVLGIVGIKGLSTIRMFDDDTLSVAIITLRHRDHTVIYGIDGIIGLGFQIHTRMTMGTPVILIGTDHLGTRQRVTTGICAIRQILGMTTGYQQTHRQDSE